MGVDVEELNSRIDVAALAGVVLTAEEHADSASDLLRYWTRKEAVLKATGEGLRTPLTEIQVSGPGERPRVLKGPDPVQLVDLDPGEGYVAAVAALQASELEVHSRLAAEL